jgi:acetyltransferase-like isoleucine patch superfamily enzyme
MKITTRDYFVHGLYVPLYGLVKYLPPPIGSWLRRLVTRPFAASMGNVRIYEGVTFWYPYRIRIGHSVTLNEWVYLSGFGELTIGDNVRIGHRTSVITSDHVYDDVTAPIHEQGLVAGQVVIEDNAWIGCNVTILKGVTIGCGAVVAAGSVVTKSVTPYAIVAGVPARQIGMRGQGNAH